MTSEVRRPFEESFFDELKDWSEIKLRILTKYFDAYQRYRGGTNPVIYYVDGFAGSGRYGEDEASGEGSPVRMARLAQELRATGRPCQLRCINIESNRRNFDRLTQALAEFDSDLVQVRFGEFSDHISDILRATRGCPAVFFLDPLGVKPVTVDALRPVRTRPDTELLIAFMTPRLRKLAGFEDSVSKDRDAKLRLVSRVLGEDPNDAYPRWLQAWESLGDAIEWEEWAASAYGHRLKRESPSLRYGLAYAVRESFFSNPKYYLVFLTRSEKAVPVMNDLICIEDDDLYERTASPGRDGQMSLFGSPREEERGRRLEQLLDEMHVWGKAHPGCCRAELIQHFVFANFGVLKQKHYRDAFSRLRQAGRVRVGPGGIDRASLEFL